jgi:hypothetical protein
VVDGIRRREQGSVVYQIYHTGATEMITPTHRAYIGFQSKTTGQNRPENKDTKTNHTNKHRVTINKPAQNTLRA